MNGQIKEKLKEISEIDEDWFNQGFEILDNHDIILKYWKLFERYLKVKDETSTRLRDIYTIGRNPLMHSRPIPKPKFYITEHAIKRFRIRMKESESQ